MFLANSESPESVIRDDRNLEGQRCYPAGANQGPRYEPESPDSSCPGLLLAPSPSFSEKDKRVSDLPKSHGQCGKAVGMGQTHGRGTNTKGPSKAGDGAQTERESICTRFQIQFKLAPNIKQVPSLNSGSSLRCDWETCALPGSQGPPNTDSSP